MKHAIARLLIAAGCTVLMPSLGSSAFAAGLAQEPGGRIEINAGAGAAAPASWYSTSRNQSVGLNIVGSILAQLGWGVALGIGADWSRLPWNTAAGPDGHVDTWIVGPELRYTDHHLGRVVPSAYLGVGWGGVSPSRNSSCSEVLGGPAARAGIGVDLQVSRRWKVGVSAGVVLQPPVVSAGICDPASAVNDPGSPEAPGNIWGLRLGGGGDLL